MTNDNTVAMLPHGHSPFIPFTTDVGGGAN